MNQPVDSNTTMESPSDDDTDNDVWNRIMRDRKKRWEKVRDEEVVPILEACRGNTIPPTQQANAKLQLFDFMQLSMERARDKGSPAKKRRKALRVLKALIKKMDDIAGEPAADESKSRRSIKAHSSRSRQRRIAKTKHSANSENMTGVSLDPSIRNNASSVERQKRK